jgi:oligopeptide/dipeptide ABC transporter ATP-binding protein
VKVPQDVLLRVCDLTLVGGPGRAALVDGVSLVVPMKGSVALVGESGCGKSLLASGVLGLLPPGVQRTRGEVWFSRGGEAAVDLARLSSSGRRRLLGRAVAMIFQDPIAHLNPVLDVETHLRESLRQHAGLRGTQARERAHALLVQVGLPRADVVLAAYPHELSGGMAQRVSLALSLAGAPALLIADEPTTALDTGTQLHVLRLLEQLRIEEGLSLLVITHDLAVAAVLGDWIAVMYAGRIVEEGPLHAVLEHPRHPYTLGLVAASRVPAPRERFAGIPGRVPPPADRPAGCVFHDRCPFVEPACRVERPRLERIEEDRAVACDPSRAGRVPAVWPKDGVP